MNNPDSEALYIKRGRRYYVWGNALTHGERFDHDPMRVGRTRLTYCPRPGHLRYSYDVDPDHAAFLVAAEAARYAMEEAISEAARSRPMMVGQQYTEQQMEIVNRFRREMAETGAMLPLHWTSSSAHEIAQAGIDAVRKAMQDVADCNADDAAGSKAS